MTEYYNDDAIEKIIENLDKIPKEIKTEIYLEEKEKLFEELERELKRRVK